MHPAHTMEGLDMGPYAEQKAHQQQKWVQMSEDERRDRREQQRLWYRRRRAQMTDEEIAEQNERRRMRYRMRRLRTNAEQAEGSTPRNPVPGLQEGSTLVNGQQVMKAAEIGKDQQRSIPGWRALINCQRTELQEQQRLSKGPQWGQVRGERVRENEGQQRHWRWKVEARKGSADADAQPSHSNLRIQDAARGVDGQSDDSETTETDDSWQGMIPSRYSGALVIANEPACVHYLACTDEGILFSTEWLDLDYWYINLLQGEQVFFLMGHA
ncbi:hypothetical protein Taro_001233 [Colocasia esculenta]|uniref:Uncharacterized protein n=1 Tax=Colocasia esculenta TaxID=4460 RepID=A0A843TE36_COLES|nr:hypothetical protein [Colocasia esculenta]